MPKGKKFDRKSGVTFHLVHRSQRDPLTADENAPQRVLVPVDDKKTKEKRLEEQQKFGIYFDDDYDYLQHLKDSKKTEVFWDPVELPTKKSEIVIPCDSVLDSKPTRIQLPSSVFASNVEEDVGLLNKAAPRGLCLDVDPEVFAAMDDDFDYNDPENQLEDNFMELANAGGNASDNGEDADEEDEDELYDDVGSWNGSQFSFEKEETKSRFTEYSMSSSVMRRNEQLTLLDDRFEKLFASYDDVEIGALECDDIEGHIDPNSDIILQCAAEFEKENSVQHPEKDRTLQIVENISSEEEKDLVDIVIKERPEDKWDCESILSTYSNLYNHPKVITIPKEPGKIRVSAKTGIPLNVLDSDSHGKLTAKALARHNDQEINMKSIFDDGTSIASRVSMLSIRPKDETLEEKKERKHAVKEIRRERRLERKANTLAFKEEKKRQEKVLLNKSNQKGMRIL